jgi:signal transduction histidine kinase
MDEAGLAQAPERSLDELRLEVAELQAARSRVVAAADSERRRIERALHDGVQQQLVALVVNLQLVTQLAVSDPVTANTLLEDIARDARAALEDVRVLAQGIYPPLLLDRGIAEALGAAASAAGIPAQVEAAQLERYPPEIEATVYFCCLEALENAARHGGSQVRASVRVWRETDALRFEVVDNGAGFEPDEKPLGTGLKNMSDRVGAQGGRLRIHSKPGDGANVSGLIPVAR